MFSEIKLVTLGVKDLDRTVSFYADALGYMELSRTRVDPEAVADAWRVPTGVGGRFVILGIPGVDSGMLRLVEWTPCGDHVWSEPARFQDLGAYGLSFRVKEINAAWDLLGRSGFREKHKPTYWEVEQNMAAWAAHGNDPEGTAIDAFQVVGEIERALGPFPHGHDVTEVQSVVVHCSDARRSQAFYSGLGFESLYDREIEHLWVHLGLPKGTRLHNINMIMPGSRPGGRVELHEYIGLPGRSLKPRSAPPGCGILMLSIHVKDLQAACARVKGLGGKPIGSALYSSPPFGPVFVHTFFGPDDEVIELFQTG